jgi:predicted nucleotidyltransferase
VAELEWVLDAVTAGTAIRGDCVYVGGSAARGWANPGSDIDVYVLGTTADAAEIVPVEGRPRVDVHALSAATLDRLFAGVYWDVIRNRQEYVGTRTERDWLLLERLHHAYPLAGQEALAGYRQRLAGSAYRHMLVQEHFSIADGYAEDCLGQLAVDDDDSAVLSGREAHLKAVDGLLSARGCFCWLVKWRARAMQETEPDLLTYDQFWRIATLADLPALGPRAWARGQVAATRELMARVDVLEFDR